MYEMRNYTLLEVIIIIQLKVDPVKSGMNQYHRHERYDGTGLASSYKLPPRKFKSMLFNMSEILAESNK